MEDEGGNKNNPCGFNTEPIKKWEFYSKLIFCPLIAIEEKYF
jgi:hypothetical protein